MGYFLTSLSLEPVGFLRTVFHGVSRCSLIQAVNCTSYENTDSLCSNVFVPLGFQHLGGKTLVDCEMAVAVLKIKTSSEKL